MGLFDTTGEEVARERLAEARKGIASLQKLLTDLDGEIQRRENGAVAIAWCSMMMEKALCVYNEVARANGAVLVRSTA